VGAGGTLDFGNDGTLIVYQNNNGNLDGTLEGQGTLSKKGSGSINRFGSTIRAGNSSINN